MLANDYLIEKLEQILPIFIDTYSSEEAQEKLNTQLNIYVSGAVNKLANEGVSNIYEEDTPQAFDYIMCLSYQVAMDMDFDVDFDLLMQKYITRVNTLRASQVNNNADLSGQTDT